MFRCLLKSAWSHLTVLEVFSLHIGSYCTLVIEVYCLPFFIKSAQKYRSNTTALLGATNHIKYNNEGLGLRPASDAGITWSANRKKPSAACSTMRKSRMTTCGSAVRPSMRTTSDWTSGHPLLNSSASQSEHKRCVRSLWGAEEEAQQELRCQAEDTAVRYS